MLYLCIVDIEMQQLQALQFTAGQTHSLMAVHANINSTDATLELDTVCCTINSKFYVRGVLSQPLAGIETPDQLLYVKEIAS